MLTRANPREISIGDYTYILPEDKIASKPLEERDASRLLVYRKGEITESRYHQLADFIPDNYLLVYNNTRVVEARLLFTKPTGAQIEVFCLEPAEAITDLHAAFQKTGSVQWKCLVGGAAKWKSGLVLEKKIDGKSGPLILSVNIEERQGEHFILRFSWTNSGLSFAEILHLFGAIPIPPYLNRPANSNDSVRYQTVYAATDGSVAAPTAGLHFTEQVINNLEKKNVQAAYLTLHVGAGTFKPVKSATLAGHDMHAEFMDVDTGTIQKLIDFHPQVIAVGTTSLRTMESIYWMGVKADCYPSKKIAELAITQWEVYDELLPDAIPVTTALKILLNRMKAENMERILCTTQIIIGPGYPLKMVRALITNFHQPQSTLLLLVSALVGDKWRNLYQYALTNNFRFLSYGDGSLLWADQA